jgi:di/tricarboxylate transporter
MLPLSTAMFETGAADVVAEWLITVVGGLGPYGLLAGLFVVTALFGQLISNTATSLIMIPIAASAATELGLDIRPVLMSVCVAAAAALLTPVATPVNLIAMGAAGYRFGDFWRLGIVVMAVFFVVAVVVVPIFWPL